MTRRGFVAGILAMIAVPKQKLLMAGPRSQRILAKEATIVLTINGVKIDHFGAKVLKMNTYSHAPTEACSRFDTVRS